MQLWDVRLGSYYQQHINQHFFGFPRPTSSTSLANKSRPQVTLLHISNTLWKACKVEWPTKNFPFEFSGPGVFQNGITIV